MKYSIFLFFMLTFSLPTAAAEDVHSMVTLIKEGHLRPALEYFSIQSKFTTSGSIALAHFCLNTLALQADSPEKRELQVLLENQCQGQYCSSCSAHHGVVISSPLAPARTARRHKLDTDDTPKRFFTANSAGVSGRKKFNSPVPATPSPHLPSLELDGTTQQAERIAELFKTTESTKKPNGTIAQRRAALAAFANLSIVAQPFAAPHIGHAEHELAQLTLNEPEQSQPGN